MSRTKGSKNKPKTIVVSGRGTGKSLSTKGANVTATKLLPVVPSAKASINVTPTKKKVAAKKSAKKKNARVEKLSSRKNHPNTAKAALKEMPNVPADPLLKNVESREFIKPEFELKPPPPKPQEEAAPLGDAPQQEVSRPYVLNIKNNSLEIIRDFRINNIKQALQQGKEYDDRVTVTYGLHGYSYAAFLSHFVTHPTKFGRIRYSASHGYDRYRHLQLNSCPLYVLQSDPNGDTKRTAVVVQTALNQFQTDAVEKAVNFDFTDLSWDLRLDLLPEAEVRIYLFPAIIANLWNQEMQELAPPDTDGMQGVDHKVRKLLEERVLELEKQLAEKESSYPESDAAFVTEGKK